MKSPLLPAVCAVLVAAAVPQVALAHNSSPEPETRIIGGEKSTEVLPWLGRMSVSCGASVISDRWMITAAHCLKSKKPWGKLPTVRIGSLMKYSGGVEMKVIKEFPHPKYPQNLAKNERYDIGLFKLERPYTGGTVKLAAQRYEAGTPTRILGWGAVKENTDGSLDMPQYLKHLDTSVVEASRCRTATGVFMPAQEYCTDNPGGDQGACYGDSGGPQVTKVNGEWTLIGVTSRGGKKCAGSPSVYTDVHAYQQWVASTIKAEDGSLPREIEAWLQG